MSKRLATALLPLVLAAASDAREPQLSVDTDRSRYRFGEPVWFYVTVENAGTDVLAVENPHCSRTRTRIEMTDGGGRHFPMTGPASCATTVLEHIPPGNDMLYAFELLEYYGVDGAKEYPFGILPTGTYEVRYRTHDSLSPPAAFRVEPLDDTEIVAFHAYVRLLDQTRPDNLREAAERFRTFVARHPESPLAAMLLCRAGVISDLFFDSRAARHDFVRLIELYPDSGYVSVAIRHLAFGMGRDRTEGIAFLREVPDELPGTLAADLARRVVARLATGGGTG